MVRDTPPIRFSDLTAAPQRFSRLAELIGDPNVRELSHRYRPWRKVRPIARQAGLDPEDTWAAVKLLRLGSWKTLELTQMGGTSFGLCLHAALQERLHAIDHAVGGGGVATLCSDEGELSDPEHQRRLIIRSLMDEAIESSRIEGAATTHRQGLDLLRSGKPPKTRSERMVVNNYAGMQLVKRSLDRELSPEFLLELQATLTADTLDNPEHAGRFRSLRDDVVVVDERTNAVVFVPPPADQIARRIARLCAFANRRHTDDDFVHPVVKACVLHFMIGYEHPFVDGNGRTARGIFYWYALKNRYRVFEFLAISQIIAKAYARYPHAYMDTELDDGDLTYFVDYKLGVIEGAIHKFALSIREEQDALRQSLDMAAAQPGTNLRQRLLLQLALKHPKTTHTAKSHAASNGITPMTARSDLEALNRRGLLSTYKVGKEVHYVPAPDLAQRLKP